MEDRKAEDAEQERTEETEQNREATRASVGSFSPVQNLSSSVLICG
jgi:hypothetical protein